MLSSPQTSESEGSSSSEEEEWPTYVALDDETPAAISDKLSVDAAILVRLNATRYRGLTSVSRLLEGTVLLLPDDDFADPDSMQREIQLSTGGITSLPGLPSDGSDELHAEHHPGGRQTQDFRPALVHVAGDTEVAPEPDNADEVEVDMIQGVRGELGELEFEVRWKNYDPSHDTWEPLLHLNGALARVCDFFAGISAASLQGYARFMAQNLASCSIEHPHFGLSQCNAHLSKLWEGEALKEGTANVGGPEPAENPQSLPAVNNTCDGKLLACSKCSYVGRRPCELANHMKIHDRAGRPAMARHSVHSAHHLAGPGPGGPTQQANRARQNTVSLAPASSLGSTAARLVGEKIGYKFTMVDGTCEWFSGEVLALTKHGKARAGQKQKHFENWADVAFEDGQTVGVLLAAAGEGCVWCRADGMQLCRAKTHKHNLKGMKSTVPKKVGASSASPAPLAKAPSHHVAWTDGQERLLRDMLRAHPLSQVPSAEDSDYHGIYQPVFKTGLEKTKGLRVGWEAVHQNWSATVIQRGCPDLERSRPRISSHWCKMVAREQPALSVKTRLMLGLCPAGVTMAKNGATLPFTTGELALLALSDNVGDQALLVDASKRILTCPRCLNELLAQAGQHNVLSWLQLHRESPLDGHDTCRVCHESLALSIRNFKSPRSREKKAERHIQNGERVNYRFEVTVEATGEKGWQWFAGTVQAGAKWRGWYNVNFEDGESLVVKLSSKAEGTVWRLAGSVQNDSASGQDGTNSAASAAIKAEVQVAVQAAARAAIEQLAQAEADVKAARKEARARAVLEAESETSSSSSESEDSDEESDVTGGQCRLWSECEDQLLVKCIGKHTTHSDWGWNYTASKVGRSNNACRARAILIGAVPSDKRRKRVKGRRSHGNKRGAESGSDHQPWTVQEEGVLRTAAALHSNAELDKPGMRPTSGNGRGMFSWGPIVELVGGNRTENSCRSRLRRMSELQGTAGSADESLACTTCNLKFSSYRGLLTHNGYKMECASKRGIWLCKLCCKAFHTKAIYMQHEKQCTTRVKSVYHPKAAHRQKRKRDSADDGVGQEQGIKKRDRVVDGNGWARKRIGSDEAPQLQVVSSAFFMNELVEKHMRKHTRQCQTTDEERLNRWSTHRMPVVVRHTGTLKGFGAFASRALKENEVIGEYAGEIIDLREMNRRAKKYRNGEEIRISAYHDSGVAATANPPSMGVTGDGGKVRREKEAQKSGAYGAAAHFFFDIGCGVQSHIG